MSYKGLGPRSATKATEIYIYRKAILTSGLLNLKIVLFWVRTKLFLGISELLIKESTYNGKECSVVIHECVKLLWRDKRAFITWSPDTRQHYVCNVCTRYIVPLWIGNFPKSSLQVLMFQIALLAGYFPWHVMMKFYSLQWHLLSELRPFSDSCDCFW